uniref:Uncharacterized protein n=1 Tax=Magallana gigas TaxID=29159 RepID=K1R7C6_MAGGI
MAGMDVNMCAKMLWIDTMRVDVDLCRRYDFFFNTRHINNSATNDDPNWDNPSDTPTSLAIQNWNTLSSVTHNSAIS